MFGLRDWSGGKPRLKAGRQLSWRIISLIFGLVL